MSILTVQAGEDQHRVEIVAVACGPDWNLSIQGGTHPHLGATALAVPRPSLRDPAQSSASVSVLCVLGHREDDLARETAHQLASLFHCQVNVCAGLHIDEANPQDISLLLHNCELAVGQLIAKMQARLEEA